MNTYTKPHYHYGCCWSTLIRKRVALSDAFLRQAVTRSTPWTRGLKRQKHSGKSYQVKLIVPEVFRPIRNAVYRVPCSRKDTDTKTLICLEIHSIDNRC